MERVAYYKMGRCAPNYARLELLLGKENISKSDTYNKADFLLWLNKKGITINEDT